HAAEVRTRMSSEPEFFPFVPRDSSTVIFDAILPEIHVLPSAAIQPVVAYYKQIMRIGHIVEDLKSDRYASLSADRKFEIYLDYLGMIRQGLRQAADAEAALRRSLGSGGRANTPGGDPGVPPQSVVGAVLEMRASKSPPSDI